MVPVHPVVGYFVSEPRAQPVVGVRCCVLVWLELPELTGMISSKLCPSNDIRPVACFEHRVVRLLLPGSVQRLLVCGALPRQ